MAILKVDYGSIGGGGTAKSGTTPAMSSSGTYEIDTELSEVHRFMWFATSTANNMQNILTYDSSMGDYFVGCIPANYGGYFKRAFSVATAQCPSITGISDGKVSIQTATSYGNVQQGYWFAE